MPSHKKTSGAHKHTPTSHRKTTPRRKRKFGLLSLVAILATALPANAYTVKSGDTLSKIARDHNTTVSRIVRLNPKIANPDLIFTGDHIRLHPKKHHKRHARASRSNSRPALSKKQTVPAFKAWARSRVSSSYQFSCLNSLWIRESNWNRFADNPSSSAYGIPQSLPGSKMATAGADWRWNGYTQMRWGLNYIRERYGSPCGAWSHSQRTGWY